MDQSPTPQDLVTDGTMENFAQTVIHASMEVPVLVDFWADWCGPCKQLMPLLEKVVLAQAGAIKLVKINADENQAICQQLRIQSLPTVMAFWQGQPVDGFQGAQTESALNDFIAKLSEKTGAAPGDDGMAAQIKAALEQVEAMIEAGDSEQSTGVLQQIMAADPDNVHARILLAELTFADENSEQATALLDSIDQDALKKDKALLDRAAKLRTRIELALNAENAGDVGELLAKIEADPQNHEARMELAQAYIASGNMAEAAESLLASIMRDNTWNEGAARAQLLKLFEAAGPMDPFTLKYRRRLSSLLFS